MKRIRGLEMRGELLDLMYDDGRDNDIVTWHGLSSCTCQLIVMVFFVGCIFEEYMSIYITKL